MDNNCFDKLKGKADEVKARSNLRETYWRDDGLLLPLLGIDANPKQTYTGLIGKRSTYEALKERKANIERRGRGSKIGKPSTKIIALDEIL
jgi:hypothetical protein